MNVVWRKEWIKPDESLWSILEKFAYVSCVERRDMLKMLGSNEVKKIKNTMIGDKRRELFQLSGFDSEQLNSLLGTHLYDHNKSIINVLIKPLHYYRKPDRTWFYVSLRWCPTCLDSGFHSWLHQFILVTCCPYHGSLLLDKCPCCNEGIPFLFSDKKLSDPFMCKCGYSLSDVYKTRWLKWNTNITVLFISYTMVWGGREG
ncbi:TniQ family protein [Paenibacillus sp. NPDC057967]|uniref:TniQ family protein n=1 Tax=Paenibacillus sp. NPDC057967 TaxID=3346293 RepID=UPI0036D91D35